MCQFSSKQYLQCNHFGSPIDLVVTEYCRASISGQYCERTFRGIFHAPGICTPCQEIMAATVTNPAYHSFFPQDNFQEPDIWYEAPEVDRYKDSYRDDQVWPITESGWPVAADRPNFGAGRK